MSPNRRFASSLALRASSKLFWIEAVRLRNIAGKFFFEAHAIMPTTMAKFTTTASQYAASRLNPVMRDRSCTDAECLNCAVSSSPEFGSGLGVDEAFAGAFCCEGWAGSSEDVCATVNNENKSIDASAKIVSFLPRREANNFIDHLPEPNSTQVEAQCE